MIILYHIAILLTKNGTQIDSYFIFQLFHQLEIVCPKCILYCMWVKWCLSLCFLSQQGLWKVASSRQKSPLTLSSWPANLPGYSSNISKDGKIATYFNNKAAYFTPLWQPCPGSVEWLSGWGILVQKRCNWGPTFIFRLTKIQLCKHWTYKNPVPIQKPG